MLNLYLSSLFVTFSWVLFFFLKEIIFFIIPFCMSEVTPYNFLKKFIYFWLHWVFVAACGLSLAAVRGSYSSLWCVGFSLWWPLSFWRTGSRCAGFSSWGSRAQLPHGMWDLPGSGLKPVSPALAGRFPATAPPGKPLLSPFYLSI